MSRLSFRYHYAPGERVIDAGHRCERMGYRLQLRRDGWFAVLIPTAAPARH